jgi:hypothetical protein
MVEGADVVILAPLDLGQQERNVVKPGIGVGPSHEGVELRRLSLVMAGVERLEVLLPLRLRSGERDLRNLPHLGGPSAKRLDELSEGEAAGRLRPKAVIVGRLHGPVY